MNERPDPNHPEELLAAYVEGGLDEPALSDVQSHLQGCALCRREVELAGSARAALATLPEVEAPAVFIPEAMAGHGPKLERRPSRAAMVWTRGLAAAGVAAAVVILAFAMLGGEMSNQAPRGDGLAAEAPASESTAPESTGAESFASPPTFRSTDRNYDAESVNDLARGLARPFAENDGTLASGTAPPTPTEKEAVDGVAGIVLIQAAECMARTAGLDPGPMPTYLERARFEGEPAFIGIFPQGPSGAPTHVVVVVASAPDCSLLHLAQVPL